VPDKEGGRHLKHSAAIPIAIVFSKNIVSATEINHTLRKELKRITGSWKLLARRKASSPNKPYDTNPYKTDSHSHRNVDPVVDKVVRGLLVSEC
jgi:hypothetical protein